MLNLVILEIPCQAGDEGGMTVICNTIPLGKLHRLSRKVIMGVKAKIPLQRGGISISGGRITRLHRHQLLMRFKVVVLRHGDNQNLTDPSQHQHTDGVPLACRKSAATAC